MRPLKLLTIRAVSSASLSIALIGSAFGTVIDFESAVTGTCDVVSGGSVDGFTLGSYDGIESAGMNNATSCSFIAPTAHSGSRYMINYNSLFGEFTKDVGTFTLDSLWVHADVRAGQSTVRFQGLDGVGGNTLYSQDVVINPLWQQVNFAGWTGIKTFTWDSIVPASSNIVIDDFTFTASSVPEPAFPALLGLGLGGLSYVRRRARTVH